MKNVLIFASFVTVVLSSFTTAFGQNGYYPFVIARGQDRAVIRNMPIQERPARPLHFYGNAVRRSADSIPLNPLNFLPSPIAGVAPAIEKPVLGPDPNLSLSVRSQPLPPLQPVFVPRLNRTSFVPRLPLPTRSLGQAFNNSRRGLVFDIR